VLIVRGCRNTDGIRNQAIAFAKWRGPPRGDLSG
jgi:hypothetical protein